MKIAIVYGTRPEQIKLTPVAEALEGRGVEVEWWHSKQSPDLVDYENSGSFWIGSEFPTMADGIADVIRMMLPKRFDALLVQGDTATAFAGAVAGFLAEVPVGHVEAGLRTYSSEPYPEEAFRHAIASFATWHFCPDEDSLWNILREMGWHPERSPKSWVSIAERSNRFFVTGNPIIDSLPKQPFRVLVTLHRRENWGERIENALDTLWKFAEENQDVVVCAIKHPNWSEHSLGRPPGTDDFWYSEPMDHDAFLWRMRQSDLIVTDSGGLQEEAAHFGVDCLVVRSQTERSVLRRLGAVEVVDPDNPDELAQNLSKRLHKRRAYGDGTAGEQIADILIKELSDAASD